MFPEPEEKLKYHSVELAKCNKLISAAVSEICKSQDSRRVVESINKKARQMLERNEKFKTGTVYPIRTVAR